MVLPTQFRQLHKIFRIFRWRNFGAPPEAAFKISIPYGDLAGRENWSIAFTAARLSGHRNFTEQNRTPDAILRPLKAATKVTACLRIKIFSKTPSV